MSYPTWLYHKDHEAKIVDSDEVPELERQGWVDNPAKVTSVVEQEPEKDQPVFKPRGNPNWRKK